LPFSIAIYLRDVNSLDLQYAALIPYDQNNMILGYRYVGERGDMVIRKGNNNRMRIEEIEILPRKKEILPRIRRKRNRWRWIRVRIQEWEHWVPRNPRFNFTLTSEPPKSLSPAAAYRETPISNCGPTNSYDKTKKPRPWSHSSKTFFSFLPSSPS